MRLMEEVGALRHGQKVGKAVLAGGALLLALFLLTLMIHAAEVEKELEGIKKKIEKEKQGITQVKKKESSVLQSLEKVEEELERKNKELGTVNSRLEAILQDLQKKEEAVGQLTSSLKRRAKLLERRAKALYKWQRGGGPFVLLNGGFSVAELMQRKRYLSLTLGYDRELVEQLRDESVRQEALKKELAQKGKEWDRERRTLVELKESVRLEREKKKKILASLRREKEVHLRALKELEQAALRLQNMMDGLSRKPLARFDPPSSSLDFEVMKGKLEFPVRGEVMSGFGKVRHPEFSAELLRKGIDIEAPLGEEIRAVERGKVIFADRFSGYGRMMIVDHGERYYTIYAHLSKVLKRIGEIVQKGEPIALLGDSDSLAGARLYFEIRKDGKALDPMPWFKKR